MTKQTTNFLQALSNKLLAAPTHKIIKGKGWAASFPKKAGVYIIRKKLELIYIGETGNIQGRLKDLCRTQNHTARRTIGTEQFASHAEYTKPSSKIRFCDNLEELLNQYFSKNLTIAFIEVELGRKELEEMFFKEYKPIHNLKVARKTK